MCQIHGLAFLLGPKAMSMSDRHELCTWVSDPRIAPSPLSFCADSGCLMDGEAIPCCA